MSHKSEKPEAFFPGLSIDPGGAALLPGDTIEKELDNIKFEVLQLEALIDAAHLDYRSNVEVNIDHYFPEPSADDLDSGQPGRFLTGYPPSGPEESHLTYSYSDGHDWNTAMIGGAVICNLSLVVPDKENKRFADLPVAVIQGSMRMKAQLLAANPKGTGQGKHHELPILLLPEEEEKIPSSLQDWKLSDLTQFPLLATITTGLALASDFDPSVVAKEAGWLTAKETADAIDDGKTVGKAKLENYVLSGDIKNFFGIKGLKAKLYKFKGKQSMSYFQIIAAMEMVESGIHGLDLTVSKALRMRRTRAKMRTMTKRRNLPARKSC